ncbi:MAG TPA: hypothetical protein VKE25_02160, partial [Actinomycetes bacterium]|nr:hypothetical protein [Actinomycetes bacterium]
MTTGDERPFDGTRPDETDPSDSLDQTLSEPPASDRPAGGQPDRGPAGPEPGHAPFASPAGWASSEGPGADAEATLPGDELAFGSARSARRPWGLIGVAAGVALAVLVGGVVFAVGKLSGGGTQPEELVPASAFAF